MCGDAESGRLGRQPTNDESDIEEEDKRETLEDPQEEEKNQGKPFNDNPAKSASNKGIKDLNIYDLRKEQYVPVLLDVQNVRFAYVSCGRCHTMALTTDGAVYCWGKNTEGQLGLLGGVDVVVPTKLDILEGVFCKMVACGRNHSLILSTAGDVYSCGRDENGKLGHTLMMPGEKLTDLKCEFQPRKITV